MAIQQTGRTDIEVAFPAPPGGDSTIEKLDRRDPTLTTPGRLAVEFQMRKLPADLEKGSLIDRMNTTCEAHSIAWQSAVDAYRDEMSDLTRMPLSRVQRAYGTVSAIVEERTKQADLHWKKASKRKAELEKAMTLPKIDPIEAMEIRSHFSRLKPGERLAACLDAMRSGDRKTVSAVLGGLDYLSGIDTETRNQILEEVPGLLFPEEKRELAEISNASDELIRSTMNLTRMAAELIPSYVGTAENNDRVAFRRAESLALEDLERLES